MLASDLTDKVFTTELNTLIVNMKKSSAFALRVVNDGMALQHFAHFIFVTSRGHTTRLHIEKDLTAIKESL